MVRNDSFARSLRVRRLFRRGDRLVVVPLDHTMHDGPIVRRQSLDDLVGRICDNGADVVVLHKGAVRHVSPHRFRRTSLVVHLNASTSCALDPDAKFMVSTVEEAIRLGADGVSVHVNLGSAGEAEQIADLARVGEACDRWNVPLIAMMYPRGPRIDNPFEPRLVGHAVTIAAEMGADIVKTVFPGSVEALTQITRDCPIPVLVSGGPKREEPDGFLAQVCAAMRGGAAGVAVGRNIFEAPDAGAMTRTVAELVHAFQKEFAHEAVLG